MASAPLGARFRGCQRMCGEIARPRLVSHSGLITNGETPVGTVNVSGKEGKWGWRPWTGSGFNDPKRL